PALAGRAWPRRPAAAPPGSVPRSDIYKALSIARRARERQDLRQYPRRLPRSDLCSLSTSRRHPRPERMRKRPISRQRRRRAREECAMWRSAFIILLLAGSPALAGQASTVLHVGTTITGNAAQTPAKKASAASSEQADAGAVGGAGAAAVVKPS